MNENIEQAKERLKEIVDFYKLNDENNYDYSDDVLISMRIVLEEIERLNNIIKEKDKDFGLLRKAQLKKCQEYENLEKLNNANYQSFIEVNNILNELKKYLNEQVDYMTHHSIERMVAFDCCRHKLQELKGSDK